MPIAAALFCGVLFIFGVTYWLIVLRPEAVAERALERRLNPAGRLRRHLSLLKNVVPLSAVPALEQVLRRSRGVMTPVERLVEQSGLRLTLGLVVLATVFCAGVAFVVLLHFTARPGIAAGGALMFGSLPCLALRHMAARRLATFEEQFPEAIDLIARALRAGHSLTTGLAMVPGEIANPVGAEFKLLHDQHSYGKPLPDALKGFAERVPLLDARFFATAVLTQRESGGNLAEVLDGLAAVIRERFRLKRHVRVLSAHGRLTGIVLGLLPIGLSGVLYVIAPAHISSLVTDPLGVRMVAVAAVLQALGIVAMRRIVNIEI
jgi:tight adherence protein B